VNQEPARDAAAKRKHWTPRIGVLAEGVDGLVCHFTLTVRGGWFWYSGGATVNVVEPVAAICSGDARRAAGMLGASLAMRAQADLPIAAIDAAMLERSIGQVRPEDGTEWDRDLRTGAGWTVDEALQEADRTPVR
jgi:hypothetical protein